MNDTTKKSYFNHWFIVFGVLGCNNLLICLLCNTAGMFVTPVMDEFGWSRTAATMYLTLFNWIAAAMQPLVGRLFDKYSIKRIMLAVIVVFGCAFIWTGTLTSPWQWNVYGVIYGVCAGFFMYLPGPVLFNRWFKQKMSLAMSLGGIVTGIIGFFLNTTLVASIQNVGWGKTRMILGLVTMIVCFLLTLLFVKDSPEKAGMQAYGADPADGGRSAGKAQAGGSDVSENAKAGGDVPAAEEGFTYQQVWKCPAFYLVLFYGFLVIILASFSQQMFSYAEAMPVGVEAAAKLFAALSIISLAIGPVVGFMYDKIGGIAGNFIICALSTVGMLLMVMGNGESLPLFYAGYGIFNVIMTSMTLGVPLLVKYVFGTRDYSKILSKVTLVLLVSGGVANIIYAQLYDISGTYATFPVMVLILAAISAAIVPLTSVLAKRSRKKFGIS